MRFENGAVIGCGVVSGQVAPDVVGDLNFTGYTERCQGEANLAETQAIERYRPSLIVWGSTDEGDPILVKTSTGSKVLLSGSREWKAVMLQRMEDRVGQFVASGARVIFLLEPPEVHPNGKGGGPLDSSDRATERMNALLKEVAARHPDHVGVVDLQARVCPSGPPCPYVVDGIGSTVATEIHAIRPDLVHYLPNGALWVARWLVPQIAAEAKKLS
jgi:hypothetical protein